MSLQLQPIYIYIFISLYPSNSLNIDLRKTETNLLYSRVSWERETKDLAMTKLWGQKFEPSYQDPKSDHFTTLLHYL